MKLLRKLLQKEGWHLAESGLPIQVGIKCGVSPFGKKHLHKTLAEYFLLLEGSLKLKVNGKALKMDKGDLLVVEAEEIHEIVFASANARLLLMMPPPVAGDKIEL